MNILKLTDLYWVDYWRLFIWCDVYLCRHFQVNSQLNSSLCPWKYPFLMSVTVSQTINNVFLELILSKILKLKIYSQMTLVIKTLPLTDLFKVIWDLDFWINMGRILTPIGKYLKYNLEKSIFCCFYLDLIFIVFEKLSVLKVLFFPDLIEEFIE